MRRSLLIALVIVLVLAFAESTATSATGPGKHVTIKGNYYTGYHYSPTPLTIRKGKTVHWSWSSDAPHDVTWRSGKHSKTKTNLQDYARTFNNVGTFRYHCSVHDFKGKVIVEAP